MKGKREILSVLMLACSLLPVCDVIAAGSTTITIPITIINQPNTCKVGFEGASILSGNTYTFQAVLLKGQRQTHPSFQAVVTCENNAVVNTALTLRPAGMHQAYGNKVGLYRVDNPTESSGNLWLTLADGSMAPIAINSGDTPTPFCTGIASDTVKNSCSLTPVTQILASTVGGPISTTLTFGVVYP
ncbi:hypothetical protein DI133_RS21605 [Escherichia coli]|nr:hypothetical protein [Escherichia coli]